MKYYKQPIKIGTYICPTTGYLVEYPIWSDDDIAEGNALLDKILQGAKENGVNPQYYIQEFCDE
jgi:hypothetical protein